MGWVDEEKSLSAAGIQPGDRFGLVENGRHFFPHLTHTHSTLKQDLFHCYPSHKDVLSDFLLPLQFSLLNQSEVMQARVTELQDLLILPQEQRGETIDGIISVKSTPDHARCAFAMATCLSRSYQPVLLCHVSTHSLLLPPSASETYPLLLCCCCFFLKPISPTTLYTSSWLPHHFSAQQTI